LEVYLFKGDKYEEKISLPASIPPFRLSFLPLKDSDVQGSNDLNSQQHTFLFVSFLPSFAILYVHK